MPRDRDFETSTCSPRPRPSTYTYTFTRPRPHHHKAAWCDSIAASDTNSCHHQHPGSQAHLKKHHTALGELTFTMANYLASIFGTEQDKVYTYRWR